VAELITDEIVEAACTKVWGTGPDPWPDGFDEDFVTEGRSMVRVALTATAPLIVAREAELHAAATAPCSAEVWSWDHFTDSQVDPYWIRCTQLGPHDEHEDSNTGLRWKDVP